jgi:hypothetical protein
MLPKWIGALACATAAVAAGTALAQSRGTDDYSVRLARAPDWRPASPEGECRLKLWVDDRARVELRGDRAVVRTQAGRPSFDFGSACTQPLPFDRIADFRVTGERARGALLDVERPTRRNDFTGAFTIDDPQAGGDDYEIVLAWRNPAAGVAPLAVGPAPWVDEARACQERVSDEFFARNDRPGSYLEFDSSIASLPDAGPRSRVLGRGWVHDRLDTWPMTYECLVDEETDGVVIAAYDVASRGRSLL